MQMNSYAKPIGGHYDESDIIFLLWAVNIKVSMVTLGASLHIWHNISDSCGYAGIEDSMGELIICETFCGRTQLGIGVAVTGILCGPRESVGTMIIRTGTMIIRRTTTTM
jgi:hypothetical protein